MSKIKCGILGATGMVGQRFVQMLNGHPNFEPVVLAASERRKGSRFGDSVNWQLEVSVPQYASQIILTGLDPSDIRDSGVKLVFSALPADIAGPLETILAGEGIWVFSNASAHRMDAHVPILIPEVNQDHLDIINYQDTPGKMITNANCSTTGLVLGLEPIRNLGLNRLHVTTYQALSGAGYPGVSSLDILENVVPYIPGEEEKMAAETKHILGTLDRDGVRDHPVEVIASCARVPVINGHLESVLVEFEEAHSADELIEIFNSFQSSAEVSELFTAPERSVIYNGQPDRPQPKKDIWNGGGGNKAGMAVTIGRLETRGKWARFYLLSHNTVRGAAGGSILNAELVVKKGLLEVD